MASVAINEILTPIVSFGLITDIHYADNDDRWNYSKTFLRRYRNSLKLVDQACHYWLTRENRISFIIQLGDIIDGLCQINQTSVNDLKTILEQFRNIAPIYHLWGNHELYNFTREELLNGPLCSFDTKNISPGHYGTFEVCPKLRIIAIDTYELSLLGVENDSESYIQAMEFLRKYNQNENINDPTGLEGHQQRFIRLNGGLTQKQLNWLKEQLVKAKDLNEKIIIIGKRHVSEGGFCLFFKISTLKKCLHFVSIKFRYDLNSKQILAFFLHRQDQSVYIVFKLTTTNFVT
jgi:manganese-dependent ADP-ribose/CDP-alcohol diphosphatase